MVGRKRKGRAQKSATSREHKTKNETENGGVSGYEQFRHQRIKDNLQRMEKLGILDLSRKLKAEFVHPKRPMRNPSQKKSAILPPSLPPRRSSRLESMTRVSYFEIRSPKNEGNFVKNVEIHIKEGSKPEIYTEEHEKFLGDCKTTWTLLVDGYDKDGHRIYDQFEGKTCHQCRQKTLGRHTNCSKCKLVNGQFCGDCLYMRYGENVIEANKNPGWICPVCRGICNCSRCRREKGWAPTGSIYRKVLSLGFRSVAHYLIQTRRFQSNGEEPAGENPLSATTSPSDANRDELSDGILKLQTDDSKDEEMAEEDVSGAYNREDGSEGDGDGGDDDDDDDDDYHDAVVD